MKLIPCAVVLSDLIPCCLSAQDLLMWVGALFHTNVSWALAVTSFFSGSLFCQKVQTHKSDSVCLIWYNKYWLFGFLHLKAELIYLT